MWSFLNDRLTLPTQTYSAAVVSRDSTTQRLSKLLRAESAGGVTLSIGMVLAICWSALNPAGYNAFWHQPLTAGLEHWHVGTPHDIVANGILTIFFFGVGLELARELRDGHLTNRSTALLPAAAAVGGMVGTALLTVGLGVLSSSPALTRGWGVPMATDIAFALGALALVARRIPRELRVFLLTLAIVDDVLSVIALAFSNPSVIRPLFLVLLPVSVFLLSFQRQRHLVLTLWVRVVATWFVLAAANVEPCLAGALVGITAPFTKASLSLDRLELRVVDAATWIALPLFALTACGIDWRAITWNGSTVTFIALLGVARLIGKVLGIVGVITWITRHHPELAPGTRGQLGGLAALCAVGFTVPLLFASQAYGPHSPEYFQTTVTLLAVSLIAAIAGCTTLWLQGRDSSERKV